MANFSFFAKKNVKYSDCSKLSLRQLYVAIFDLFTADLFTVLCKENFDILFFYVIYLLLVVLFSCKRDFENLCKLG